MGFIADPNAGPTPKMADAGVLFNGGVASTSPATVSKSLVSALYSAGLTFNIQCDQSGTFTIMTIDPDGGIHTLQGPTPYSAGIYLPVTFNRYIREAYVIFTPSAPATNLYIDAFCFGRGF